MLTHGPVVHLTCCSRSHKQAHDTRLFCGSKWPPYHTEQFCANSWYPFSGENHCLFHQYEAHLRAKHELFRVYKIARPYYYKPYESYSVTEDKRKLRSIIKEKGTEEEKKAVQEFEAVQPILEEARRRFEEADKKAQDAYATKKKGTEEEKKAVQEFEAAQPLLEEARRRFEEVDKKAQDAYVAISTREYDKFLQELSGKLEEFSKDGCCPACKKRKLAPSVGAQVHKAK